ncbi:glycoside hydrolase family 30 beta sandwich domain-containing protein [uncultured Chitinophaga sp.]|uniref:glycoside hydrolase family 30 protein n=1 Tax=uncultured Chitinophaga sp. TaxID=339340 RepID=UPI0025CE56FD|nr:glycoside hydrolase family 30 beta sandwich domain-containing protein [uncultured Chitinophaga sp.]
MIDRKRVHQHIYAFVLVTALGIGCKGDKANGQGPGTPPANTKSDVEAWVTKPDKFALFAKQTTPLVFKDTSNAWPTIEIDTTVTYQEIDGFGYTLTGGSATLINGLPAATQDALLKELFLTDSTFIGVSYLRVSIGASDLSASSFTYDDMPDGQTDPELKQFSINKEKTDLLPILKKIVALNPNIKILGSPWSAPTWMKTNNAFKGGSLKPEYYSVYAQYFVKYIQAMKAEGITMDAITIQNEPLHGGNVPSMVMQSAEQGSFIKNHLGPAFKAAGITTKIILYDHNADRPDYPMDILADTEAAKYVDGSAFHLYGGPITALTQVHDAYPDKHVYFTEQWVGGPGNFGEDLKWHISTLIIGATRNWSRNVLEWNLAADPDYKPHTDGGCTSCLGALTISSGGGLIRNVAYYIIAHASKFVRPGSVRIASNIDGGMQNVAFKTPDGKKVLIVINTGNVPLSFNIKYRGKIATASLNNGAVGTYVW